MQVQNDTIDNGVILPFSNAEYTRLFHPAGCFGVAFDFSELSISPSDWACVV
jgi:hypothetical protein